MRPYQTPPSRGIRSGEEDEDGEEEDRLHHCPRLIDAQYIHGDEQEFWSARQNFRRSGARARAYYPVSDRQAQILLSLVQRVPRVSSIAAFRLFVFGLKCLLLPQLATSGGAGSLLPLRVVGLPALKMGVLQDAAREREEKAKSDKKDEKEGTTSSEEKKGEKAAPASSDGSSSASPSSSEKS